MGHVKANGDIRNGLHKALNKGATKCVELHWGIWCCKLSERLRWITAGILERSKRAEKILHQGKNCVQSISESQFDVSKELLELQDKTRIEHQHDNSRK